MKKGHKKSAGKTAIVENPKEPVKHKYAMQIVDETGRVVGILGFHNYPDLRMANQQADLENLAIDIEQIVHNDGGTLK